MFIGFLKDSKRKNFVKEIFVYGTAQSLLRIILSKIKTRR